MPWVNIFEHEECEVVIGLVPYGNTYPPAPWDVFPLAKNPATPQTFWEQVGIYSIDVTDGATGVRVIGVPGGSPYALPWGMYIIPSGGIAGRRFRARVLQQTSGLNEVGPDDGLIQCPGYFFDGCGFVPSYDEAALVPYNEYGNLPVDSEWYEFEVVAAEPDAGGLDTTGWVGLFNYDYFGGQTNVARGFFEWQVWVDGPEPSACFWTDIVNATQECGETPPEPEYPMEVTLRCYRGPPTPAGYAHSTGLNPTDSVNAPRSYAALAGAISVELLALSDGPNDAEGNDLPYDPSSYSELSAPIPLDDGYFDGATVLDPPGAFVVNEYGYWTFGSDDPSIGGWRVGVVRVTTADSVVTYSVLLDWGGFG